CRYIARGAYRLPRRVWRLAANLRGPTPHAYPAVHPRRIQLVVGVSAAMQHVPKRRALNLAAAGLAALIALSLSACSAGAVPTKESASKPRPSVPPGGILLQGAGATFPAVLYEEWFRRYQSAHPTDIVAYDAVGSGEGVRRFIGRNVDHDEQVD